jgi:signal transduction histidine kinase
LLLLWLFILGVCGALAFVILGVYQLGAEAQTERQLELATQAVATLRAEYSHEQAIESDGELDSDYLEAILNATLADLPGIEGGYWHEVEDFVAYAYPTHQGSIVKRDVPSTEQPRIEAAVRRSLALRAPVTEVTPKERETLVLTVAPVGGPETRLAAWTMSRVPTFTGKAYQQVNRGQMLLLGFALLSGGWIAFGLQRWVSQLGRVERALASSEPGTTEPIAKTGDTELDRIVDAINDFRTRLAAARTREAELGQALARSERFGVMGRMAAAVAHEVRNPIAAMRLKAENALAGSDRPEAALQFIVKEIERLDAMVRSLLSKAERLQLHRRDVAIAGWLAERIEGFRERAESAGIRLESRVEVTSWEIDPSAVGRALDNLLSNALAHAPASGGRVLVSALQDAHGSMLVQVCDNGPGVPAEVEPRLFEPFVSTRADGVGLGLALVREIARAHGGNARYKRQSELTCFEMEIPWRES